MAATPGGFEIVEHTADTAIRGWAPHLEALFVVMAQGLFKVIGAEATISRTQKRTLHLESVDRNELLHDWLETLNALHQVHRELYTGFDVAIANGRLKASVHGGPLGAARGDLGTEVKAVTWHDLTINETPEGLEAYVLLDI